MNDTTQPPAAPPTLRQRVAAIWQGLGNAWEVVSARVFLWRKTGNVSAAKMLVVILAALVALAILIDAMGFMRPTKPVPAAVQINPLAPLVARIEAVEAQVSDLQDRAPAAAYRPAVRRAPASAPPAPGAPAAGPAEAPAAPRWGTTDLDREISAFTESFAQPTQEPTK